MSWKSIGIVGKPNAIEQNLSTFQEMAQLLQQWNIHEVHYEQSVAQILQLKNAPPLTIEDVIKQSDLILVVGGDGSMLNAARIAVDCAKPVLGINRGHLGFLTDIGADELATRLHRVIQGEYYQESRFLLEGAIFQGNNREAKLIAKQIALNDIVLSAGSSSQLIEFDLWIENDFVCRQRADGLIISTPTGSTAYSLSAGGPILHPQSNSIVIVPMMPHKLTSRPIVVDNNVEIKIVLRSEQSGPALSFDSQVRFDFNHTQSIYIRKYTKALQLIHPKDYDYFRTLRDKLSWENQ